MSGRLVCRKLQLHCSSNGRISTNLFQSSPGVTISRRLVGLIVTPGEDGDLRRGESVKSPVSKSSPNTAV